MQFVLITLDIFCKWILHPPHPNPGTVPSGWMMKTQNSFTQWHPDTVFPKGWDWIFVLEGVKSISKSSSNQQFILLAYICRWASGLICNVAEGIPRQRRRASGRGEQHLIEAKNFGQAFGRWFKYPRFLTFSLQILFRIQDGVDISTRQLSKSVRGTMNWSFLQLLFLLLQRRPLPHLLIATMLPHMQQKLPCTAAL